MASVTLDLQRKGMVSGFRAQVSAEAVEVDALAQQVCERIHRPFDRRPDRLPTEADEATWKQYFRVSLPLAIERVALCLLVGMQVRELGRAWAITVLEPLADLVGCDVIPRPEKDADGTLIDETAEASIAVSSYVMAVHSNAPAETIGATLERAKAELDDMAEVAR